MIWKIKILVFCLAVISCTADDFEDQSTSSASVGEFSRKTSEGGGTSKNMDEDLTRTSPQSTSNSSHDEYMSKIASPNLPYEDDSISPSILGSEEPSKDDLASEPKLEKVKEEFPDEVATQVEIPLSDEKTAKYIDMVNKGSGYFFNASDEWYESRSCFSCHTNTAYLYTMPSIASNPLYSDDIRENYKQVFSQLSSWLDTRFSPGSSYLSNGGYLIPTVMAFVFSKENFKRDADTLSDDQLKQELDLLTALKQEIKEGNFNWFNLGIPPMEHDNDYGHTLAALVFGVNEGNQNTDEIRYLIDYFEKNKAQNLHQKGMRAWANSYYKGDLKLFSTETINEYIDDLVAAQNPDGGWRLASLGKGDPGWQDTGTLEEQTGNKSDGYGTGFVLMTLLKNGFSINSPAIKNGLLWLEKNQVPDLDAEGNDNYRPGSWFTRSQANKTNYITNAGTGFVLMSLDLVISKSESLKESISEKN